MRKSKITSAIFLKKFMFDFSCENFLRIFFASLILFAFQISAFPQMKISSKNFDADEAKSVIKNHVQNMTTREKSGSSAL